MTMIEVENFYFKHNKKIRFKENKYDVLKNVSALIVLTEWKKFRFPDFK